jgi:NAD(P)-dependent dehydrogenase (short-subunit alcohol dehydrogenase family)
MSQARQVAIVSGSSRGIGRAIALELARRGMAVVVNYRSAQAEAQAVAAEVRALGVDCLCLQADVADPDQARGLIREVQAQWGRIDVLVNNAGITRDKTLRKLTDDDWLQVINTNLGSVYYCTSAAMPIMIEQNYGRIINISSYVGQAGNFGQANYGASKGGIIAFTKTAALELARYGITVNAIAPGFTETEMLSKVRRMCRTRFAPAFRWGALASRKRWPRWSPSSPPRPTTSPASRSTSTAAYTCRGA